MVASVMKSLALVIPFRRAAPPPRSRDWSAQEMAEFYRVQAALARIGMTVSIDKGLSDEGDPWFVFCREPDGEPIIHFARIDSCYVMDSPVLGAILRGLDLRVLVGAALEREEVRRSALRDKEHGSSVAWHPAALLGILVGVVYFLSASPTEASPARDQGARDDARIDAGSRKGPGEGVSAHAHNDIAAQASVLSAQIGQLAAAILVAVSVETMMAGDDAAPAEIHFAAPQTWTVETIETSHESLPSHVAQDAAMSFAPPESAPPDDALVGVKPVHKSALTEMVAPQTQITAAPAPITHADESAVAQHDNVAPSKTGAITMARQAAHGQSAAEASSAELSTTSTPSASTPSVSAVLQAALKPSITSEVEAVDVKKTATAADGQQDVTYFTFGVEKDGTVIKASQAIHIVDAIDAAEFKAAVTYAYSHKSVASDSYQNKIYTIELKDPLDTRAPPSESVALEYRDGSKIEIIGTAETLHHLFDLVA